MTPTERHELLLKCSKCPYNAVRTLPYTEVEDYDDGHRKFTRERTFNKPQNVCKMLSLLCMEIDEPCPLPNLTEDEIEEREIEFDESE